LDDADELVAGDPREAVVAALQLEIGVADAGEEDADEGESGPRTRSRDVRNARAAVIEGQRLQFTLRIRLPATPSPPPPGAPPGRRGSRSRASSRGPARCGPRPSCARI